MDIEKVKVKMRIVTVVETVDLGYLGGSTSVEEHMSHALSEVSHWQFMVKKGGTDPVQVPVSITVTGIEVVPKTKEN